VAAFVTFTTQEAKERAMKYLCKFNENGTDNGDYIGWLSLGKSLKVHDAPEPSNIIWENIQITKWQKYRNLTISCIIIFFALIATFFFFTWLKLKGGDNYFKYPLRTNC